MIPVKTSERAFLHSIGGHVDETFPEILVIEPLQSS